MAVPVIQSGYTEWVSTAQVSTIPLDQCSGITAGDLLLLIVGNEDSTATPQFEDNVTGFDLQFEIGDGTSDNHLAVYTRIATETEEATTNVPTVSSDYAYGWYLRITGAHPTAFWNFNTAGQTQSSAPIDVTGATPDVDDVLAFVFAGLDGADGGAGTIAGTGWTKWRSLEATAGGSSGASGVVGTKSIPSQTATGTATADWSVSDGTAGIQFGIAPVDTVPTVTDITPDEFDDAETGIVITGTNFNASQGAGKVELCDSATYATANKQEQDETAWADTEITFTCDFGTIGPGSWWIFVTNSNPETQVTGYPVTVHRAHAIKMSASGYIAASGENTTFQLTPPSGKSSANFGGGRIQDDENPTDNVDIDLNDYREDEWCFEGVAAAEEAQYEFRVTVAGAALNTYTETPKVTFSAGVTLVISACAHAHTADDADLTQHHVLAIQDSLHAHAADDVVLVIPATVLVIADALHAHAAESPELYTIGDAVGYRIGTTAEATDLEGSGHNFNFRDGNNKQWAVFLNGDGDWQLYKWDDTIPSSPGDEGSWAPADKLGGGTVILEDRDSTICDVQYDHSYDGIEVLSWHASQLYFNRWNYNEGTDDWNQTVTNESPGITVRNGSDGAFSTDSERNTWIAYYDASNNLKTRVRTGVATWVDGPTLETGQTGATAVALVRMELDGDGFTIVAYAKQAGATDQLWLAYRDDSWATGAAWTKQVIDSSFLIDGNIAIANGGGNTGQDYVLVVATDSGGDTLAYRRDALGVWSSAALVTTSAAGSPRVIARFNQKQVYVVYPVSDGVRGKIADIASSTWGFGDEFILIRNTGTSTWSVYSSTDKVLDEQAASGVFVFGSEDFFPWWAGRGEFFGNHSLNIFDCTHAHAADTPTLVHNHILAIQDAAHAHTADTVDLVTGIVLVIEDAAHAHAADTPDLAQTHVLAIQEATHAHAADTLDLIENKTLVIEDAAHAHTADTLDLIEHQVLAIQDADHAHTADAPDLVQHHVLVISEATHAHAADTLDLIENKILVIEEAAHSHTADTLDLIEHQVLAIQDASHAHAADTPDLTQHHVLVIAEASHAHAADTIDLATSVVLVIQDATHAHAAEEPDLVEHQALVIQEALHSHTADSLDLVQAHVLAIDEATHAHAADGLDLVQHHVLVISEATHGHTAETPTLVQAHVLAVSDAAHAHAADTPTLAVTHVLAIEECSHAHAAEVPDLTQHHVLAISDALHSHTAESLLLVVEGVLEIQEAAHAHTADSLDLTQHHVLAIADADHAHAAETPTLAVTHVLVVEDALHGHAADDVVLVVGEVLVIADALHAHAAEVPVLAVTHVLVTEDATHAHAAETLDLVVSGTLEIQEAHHAHAAETLTLTQHHVLVVADAVHAHTADGLDLIENKTLVIAEATHAHAADDLDLIENKTLAIQDAAHSHTADDLNLTQHHALVIAEAFHALTSEVPDLFQAHTLVIGDALHTHTAEDLALSVASYLVVADALHAHAADSLDLAQAHVLAIDDTLHAHSADTVDWAHKVLKITDCLHDHAADSLELGAYAWFQTQRVRAVVGEAPITAQRGGPITAQRERTEIDVTVYPSDKECS